VKPRQPGVSQGANSVRGDSLLAVELLEDERSFLFKLRPLLSEGAFHLQLGWTRGPPRWPSVDALPVPAEAERKWRNDVSKKLILIMHL